MNTMSKSDGYQPNVRFILASLWVARMLSGLQGDTVRLNDADSLQALLAKSGPVVATRELLLVMSLLFVIPILMSAMTLLLKYPLARVTNRIFGSFFALFDLVFLILCISVWKSAGYEFVWSTAYLVFTGLIAWYAWKLPAKEA